MQPSKYDSHQFNEAKQYYNTTEIAVLLRVDDATVKKWITDGELQGVDVGREWRVSTAHLHRFLQSKT